MYTQNVKVNGATEASRICEKATQAERYGWTAEYGWSLSPSSRNAQQQGYLNELCHFNDQWQPEKPQRLFALLMAMAKNVLDSVTNWQDVRDFGEKPRVSYAVMRPWLEAMALAPELCGQIGTETVAYVRHDLATNFEFECAMADLDRP